MMTTARQQSLRVSSEASPSDGLARFIGAGAWAAMASGVALVVSLLMEWLIVPHERLGPEAFLTGSYLVSCGLRLLSIALLPWALIGTYGRRSRAAGAFGLWAFAVAFLGATLTVGSAWAEVLLIVSIPVTMFLDPTPGSFQESIGQSLLGISVATLGWYAPRDSSREAKEDAR